MITGINSFNHRFSPSFGAGKVDLYSDFDSTYCPVSHSDMHFATPEKRPDFVRYCNSMNDFFDKTKDGLKFHITTGRTFGEYQNVSTLIKNKGFRLPLPDTFIAKNGSDEYIKTGTDGDFYDNNVFPFSYDKTNIEKEADIKAKTGWDGEKIKTKLKELLKKYNFRIVEADSENSPKDYGEKSLFFYKGLPDERNRRFEGTDKPEWVAGLRNDGHCKIFVSYPPDMLTTPERKAALKDIQNQLDGLDFKAFRSVKQDRNGKNRVVEILEPKVSGAGDSKHGLTKLYDTKEAVKRAVENNDLVIAAGDDGNDFIMLNPLQYITPSKEAKKDSVIKDFEKYKSKPDELMKKLDENNPAHKEILDALRELPFVGIAVQSGKNGEVVRKLSEAFGENSKVNKVITIENAQLEEGIKQAVILYSSQNPAYEKQLNSDLRHEVMNERPMVVEDKSEDKKEENIETSETKKKGSIGAVVALFAGITLGITALIHKIKGDKKPASKISDNKGKMKA